MSKSEHFRQLVRQYLEDNPTATIRDVQIECGFSSPSHAYHYVKEVRGVGGDSLRVQLAKAIQRIKELEAELARRDAEDESGPTSQTPKE